MALARRRASMIPASNTTMITKNFAERLVWVLPLAFVSVAYPHLVNAQAQDDSAREGARELETSVLQKVIGFTGDELGAEVIAVTPGEGDTEIVDIVIPVSPNDVDQVIVTRPDGTPFKKKRIMEISRDHENDEVGVVLRLNKKDRLGFRLKLIDLPDDQ